MSREAFERIHCGGNARITRRNEHGDYVSPAIQDAWAGWQAARSAALEEAASAAFNHFVDVCRERKVDQDFVRVWCSSDAIRALKEEG